jgi:hypothetical protein
VLEELKGRYGAGAIIAASPRMLDSGETYRWEVQIDGLDVPGVHAHARRDPQDPDWTILFLVHGEEEVEIGRWSTKKAPHAPSGPASVVRRLGDLR